MGAGLHIRKKKLFGMLNEQQWPRHRQNCWELAVKKAYTTAK